jgi:hypothetical protein
MASNWEKPGFEVVTIGAECTAYCGSQAAMQRSAGGHASVAGSGETLSHGNGLSPDSSALEKGNRRLT